MGSNSEYVYGIVRKGVVHDEHLKDGTVDWNRFRDTTTYSNAVKVVGYETDGELSLGILQVDEETGEMIESPETSMWTHLDEAGAARLIRALQKQSRRVFGQNPW